MQKILQKLRDKPKQFRMTIAVALALICTAAVASLWGFTMVGDKKPETAQAPSPFNALGASIKSTIKNSDFKSGTSQTQSSVQVIDASESSDPAVAHDETNPYQEANQ